MNSPSLQLELEVRNVASVLDQNVHRLLDLLSEDQTTFSLRIIDKGSLDDTLEVASELARQYPQICVERRSKGAPALHSDQIFRLHAAEKADAQLLARLIRWANSAAGIRRRQPVMARLPQPNRNVGGHQVHASQADSGPTPSAIIIARSVGLRRRR